MWGFSGLLEESIEKLEMMAFYKLSLSSRQARQHSPTLVPHHNKGFINLQFLQELSCQKPCWDQARLSSLVNKQGGCSLSSCPIPPPCSWLPAWPDGGRREVEATGGGQGQGGRGKGREHSVHVKTSKLHCHDTVLYCTVMTLYCTALS